MLKKRDNTRIFEYSNPLVGFAKRRYDEYSARNRRIASTVAILGITAGVFCYVLNSGREYFHPEKKDVSSISQDTNLAGPFREQKFQKSFSNNRPLKR